MPVATSRICSTKKPSDVRVLLVPEQFPTDESPMAGIFMREQIKALNLFSEPVVFNSSPWYRGMYQTDGEAQYYDLHIFDRKWTSPLRLAAYRWWENRSYQLARKIPRCDVIHLHGAALRGEWVRKLAQDWEVPYVVTEHTGPWSAVADRPRIWRRAKRCLENAAAVLPVSQHLAREIAESGIKPKRAVVAGNPVDTNLFSLRPRPLMESRTIVFIGRLDPFKGGLRTLQAFDRSGDRLRDYRLTIIGEGPEGATIREFISEYKLLDRVDFQERSLSRVEMRDVFHHAAFLVFPSRFESFGLVAAEALATGLPAVITDRTGPKDFSTEASTIPVEPDRVDDIARGMVEMVERLGEFDPLKIRLTIEEGFGINTYAERLKGLYDQIR